MNAMQKRDHKQLWSGLNNGMFSKTPVGTAFSIFTMIGSFEFLFVCFFTYIPMKIYSTSLLTTQLTNFYTILDCSLITCYALSFVFISICFKVLVSYFIYLFILLYEYDTAEMIPQGAKGYSMSTLRSFIGKTSQRI